MQENEFVRRFPVVFHMTNATAWSLIQQHGLLSTKAICGLAGLSNEETLRQTRTYRPRKVRLGKFTLRDQMPLRPHNLVRNLIGSGFSPEDWHALLNERVFFATEARFIRELRQSYISEPVTILVFDSEKLLARQRDTAELCRYNSGASRMPNHMKSRAIFEPFASFVYETKRSPKELTVLDAVPNAKSLVEEVIDLDADESFRWTADTSA
jgi:hypothetical protein